MTLPRAFHWPTREIFLQNPTFYLSELYDDLAAEVNAPSWKINGQTAVGAAAVTVAVAIDADRFPLYILVTPSWLTTFRVTGVSVTGFTVDFGTAPGGTGGTIDWLVLQPEAGPV